MDDEQSQYIKVRSAVVNLFFNECTSPVNFELANQFHFYLKSDFMVTYENIGLDTESPVWEYFASNLKYNGETQSKRSLNLSIQIEIQSQKAEKVIENFNEIQVKVDLDYSIDLTRKMAFYDKVKQFYLPKFLYVDFQDKRTLIKNVGFDFESPYIMEFTSFDVFSRMIKAIQNVICEDANQCQTMSDIRQSINKNEKFVFNFSYYSQYDSEVSNYKVVFNLYELYYYRDKDPEKKIKYNLNFRSKEDYTTNKIIDNYLGLMFLKKVKVVMSYNSTSKDFSLKIMDKAPASKFQGFAYLWILLVSLIISFLFLCKVDLEFRGKSFVNYQSLQKEQ